MESGKRETENGKLAGSSKKLKRGKPSPRSNRFAFSATPSSKGLRPLKSPEDYFNATAILLTIAAISSKLSENDKKSVLVLMSEMARHY